jgi:hypothetical protein
MRYFCIILVGGFDYQPHSAIYKKGPPCVTNVPYPPASRESDVTSPNSKIAERRAVRAQSVEV